MSKKNFNVNDQVKIIDTDDVEFANKVGKILGWLSNDPSDMYLILLDGNNVLMSEDNLELIPTPSNNVLDN
jgi:hypothetical protein